MLICEKCDGNQVWKYGKDVINGYISQKYKCKVCGYVWRNKANIEYFFCKKCNLLILETDYDYTEKNKFDSLKEKTICERCIF